MMTEKIKKRNASRIFFKNNNETVEQDEKRKSLRNNKMKDLDIKGQKGIEMDEEIEQL
jgi:hypothetical protein